MALLQPPPSAIVPSSFSPRTLIHAQFSHRRSIPIFPHIPTKKTFCNFDERGFCSAAPKSSAIAVQSEARRLARAPACRFAGNYVSKSRVSAVAVRASKSALTTRRVLPFRALLALSAAAAIVFLRRSIRKPLCVKRPIALSHGNFLALSAAAAIVFLRRRRNLQQLKVRGSVAFEQGEEMATMMKKIDTHLHVWASPEEAKKFPYFPGQEPTLPGSADVLLKSMADAGVDGAVIVQPINHKFDHSYVSSVLQKYPAKFVGMCLADPTEGGGGVEELQRLIEEENYSGVRFNPYLWPPGQKMTNQVGKAMFAKAGELGVPVGFMCFKGLLLHVDEIEELCREFPATTVLMDHLGFCKPPLTEEEAEAWNRLLNLSKYSQVYVKLSAFFRVSREPFPYKDTWPLLRQLLESYGANRLMWGSDFPFVTTECGYTNACQVLSSSGNSAEALCSEEELEALMGGTALSVFKGGWRGSNLKTDKPDLSDEILA